MIQKLGYLSMHATHNISMRVFRKLYNNLHKIYVILVFVASSSCAFPFTVSEFHNDFFAGCWPIRNVQKYSEKSDKVDPKVIYCRCVCATWKAHFPEILNISNIWNCHLIYGFYVDECRNKNICELAALALYINQLSQDFTYNIFEMVPRKSNYCKPNKYKINLNFQ